MTFLRHCKVVVRLVVTLITVSGLVNLAQSLNINIHSRALAYDDYVYGPCQSDEDCPVHHVCLDGSGTCESCLAWDSLDNAPVACSGIINHIVDDEDYSYDDVFDIKPCMEEWDCPLGEWCYKDTGTCESCSDLCKSQTKACEKECSIWLTSERNSKHLTIVVSASVASGVTVIIIAIIVAVCLWKKRTIKSGVQEETTPSPVDV